MAQPQKALTTGITGQDADLQALLDMRQCQDVVRQLHRQNQLKTPY